MDRLHLQSVKQRLLQLLSDRTGLTLMIRLSLEKIPGGRRDDEFSLSKFATIKWAFPGREGPLLWSLHGNGTAAKTLQ